MSFLPPHRRGRSPTVLGAIATILAAMADETEILGAQLCADPALVTEHTVTLQAIDRLAQQLDQLALVIGAQDPQAAIAQVSLTGLKDKLEAMIAAPVREL